MELSAKRVFQILKKNGVNYLYHANSVLTSCQFLREKALLSRGSIESKALFQTSQKSDDLDKRFGVWFDIFTDSVDIHERTKSINFYGPVMFVFDIDSLMEIYNEKIWVTKTNPTKWAGLAHNEQWFISESELETDFVKGRFDQMIVFRNCDDGRFFSECLKEIILDDPLLQSRNNKIDCYSNAYGALKISMTLANIQKPIKRRKCKKGCTCVENYSENNEHLNNMYSLSIPSGH